jgi:putative GTP pyrophosphokinase
MPEPRINKKEEKLIDALVAHYLLHKDSIELIAKQVLLLITDSKALRPFVHSAKWRLKEPSHLKGKLVRKWKKCKTKGIPFGITKENLFTEINDLAGFRILHLYTKQIEQIHKHLIEIFTKEHYYLRGNPEANTWDDESREFFANLNIETIANPRMYTSVHYIFERRVSNTYSFEIQVRTLAEELWGEVDHTINYPDPIDNVACKEQIRVLARVASSCSRLVDSIFTTFEDTKQTAATPKVNKQTQKNKLRKP